MRTKAEPTKKAMLNNTENDADIRVRYEYSVNSQLCAFGLVGKKVFE